MVYFSKIAAAAALFAPTALAAPVEKRQSAVTDVDVLQFALTLEHLENVFYRDALMKWPVEDFMAAGYTWEYYNNLKYISFDELSHVQALTAALSEAGATPVAQCEYSFPYTDVKSFVGLASVLEGVGSAAYLGAAPAIMSKEYLGVAGAILVTEAIHTGVHRFVLDEVAEANPYGSALTPNSAFSLAAAFITSCPSSNVALPFMAYPTLTATQGIPAAPGIQFTFSTDAPIPSTPWITFVNGLSTISQPATVMGNMIAATIPETVSGQTYAILTNSNVTMIADSAVAAGPAIIEVTPPAPEFAGKM